MTALPRHTVHYPETPSRVLVSPRQHRAPERRAVCNGREDETTTTPRWQRPCRGTIFRCLTVHTTVFIQKNRGLPMAGRKERTTRAEVEAWLLKQSREQLAEIITDRAREDGEFLDMLRLHVAA